MCEYKKNNKINSSKQIKHTFGKRVTEQHNTRNESGRIKSKFQQKDITHIHIRTQNCQ